MFRINNFLVDQPPLPPTCIPPEGLLLKENGLSQNPSHIPWSPTLVGSHVLRNRTNRRHSAGTQPPGTSLPPHPCGACSAGNGRHSPPRAACARKAQGARRRRAARRRFGRHGTAGVRIVLRVYQAVVLLSCLAVGLLLLAVSCRLLCCLCYGDLVFVSLSCINAIKLRDGLFHAGASLSWPPKQVSSVH